MENPLPVSRSLPAGSYWVTEVIALDVPSTFTFTLISADRLPNAVPVRGVPAELEGLASTIAFVAPPLPISW